MKPTCIILTNNHLYQHNVAPGLCSNYMLVRKKYENLRLTYKPLSFGTDGKVLNQ